MSPKPGSTTMKKHPVTARVFTAALIALSPLYATGAKTVDDFQETAKKVPANILENLEASQKATIGLHYKRQLSYGLTDLNLHSFLAPEQIGAPAAIGNRVMSNVYFPPPEDTAFVGSFGHLMGYDAGYYGYAWADVISADMASIFEKSDGYLKPEFGMRLRNEIFARGNSRDITQSIEAFLGRGRSMDAFLKKLGIATAD